MPIITKTKTNVKKYISIFLSLNLTFDTVLLCITSTVTVLETFRKKQAATTGLSLPNSIFKYNSEKHPRDSDQNKKLIFFD